MKPLCIDLFCGLGGWTEGFLSEGYDVVGFDIERRPYPAQLVLQDVLTLHGSQFRNAAVIVASPPCQKYSWLAMPWSRSDNEKCREARELREKWEREGPDNRLFEACFRISKEAGVPIVIENVAGAQEWVGMARARFGRFFLWGDVDSIGLRIVRKARNPEWIANWIASPLAGGIGNGTKIGGDWFSDPKSTCRRHSSKSPARKAASAQIAKIPFPLAQHIARCFKPEVHA